MTEIRKETSHCLGAAERTKWIQQKKVSSGFTQSCLIQTLQGYTLEMACVWIKNTKKLPCSKYTVPILTVPKLRFCSAINFSKWQLSVATLIQLDRSTLTSVFSCSSRYTHAGTTPYSILQILGDIYI